MAFSDQSKLISPLKFYYHKVQKFFDRRIGIASQVT